MSVATPVVDTWDGVNRRIYLKQGVSTFHWIDDIYVEYRNQRRLVEDFRKWNPFMVASGNEPKGGGKATPRLLKLLEGVKVVPFNESNEISVNGEAITDNADVDPTLFDISTITFPVIINYQPPSAEVIVVDAISEALDYSDVVHIDTVNGASGTIYPFGTSAQPVNNLADAKVLISAYGLDEVKLKNTLVQGTDDISNLSWKGFYTTTSIIVLGGGSTLLSQFYRMTLTGLMNGRSTSDECILSNVMNISGGIIRSIIVDTISIDPNFSDTFLLLDSASGVQGPGMVELDHNNSLCDLSVRNWTGSLSINNFTQGNNASFDLRSGTIRLQPTCTSGTVVVRGDGKLIDANGDHIPTGTWNGVTVVNETTMYLFSLIQDIMEGDVIPTPSQFRILHKVSKAVLVQKNANEVDGLTQLTE